MYKLLYIHQYYKLLLSSLEVKKSFNDNKKKKNEIFERKAMIIICLCVCMRARVKGTFDFNHQCKVSQWSMVNQFFFCFVLDI